MRTAEDIKEFSFDFLPNSPHWWIVIFWGKVQIDREGSYRIRLILNQLKGKVINPTIDFYLDQEQIFVDVNLGIVRAFPPGTIIYDKKIVAYVHEYRQGHKEIIITPSEVAYGAFGDFLDLNKIKKNVFNVSPEMQSIPVVKVKDKFNNVIIPCSVLADYYFFGKPKLIKFILEGLINRNVKARNLVYDPTKMTRNQEGTVAYIRLRKDMFDVDAYKIARLAHDEIFWNACTELSHNLICKSHDDPAYLKCGLPYKKEAKIRAYGRRLVDSNDVLYYLVYKIVHCDSPAPFEILIRSRENPGHRDEMGGGVNKNRENNEAPKAPDENSGLPKLRPSNKTPDDSVERKVGSGNANFKSFDKDVNFYNCEQNNIDQNNIISENEIIGEGGTHHEVQRIKQLIDDLQFTTNIEKNGNLPIIRLNLEVPGPTKPDQSPLYCFEFLEKAIEVAVFELKNVQKYQVNSCIRCPKPNGESQYTIFPIENYREKDEQTIKYKKFCLLNVKRKRYTEFRRMLIHEIVIAVKYFYIFDIQPKYRRVFSGKDNIKKVGFSSNMVIIISRNHKLSDSQILDIMDMVVKSNGKWNFEIGNCKKFKHTVPENMRNQILDFVTTELQF